MSDNTPLGERMKRYEHTFRQFLPRRAYTLMRLDMRAAHTYLRHAERPFDQGFMTDMDMVTARLCEEIPGARFAYTQSDEISLLVTDFDTTQTEPWFGGNLAKLVSVSAGLASALLAKQRYLIPGVPHFDSRVWSMADPVEVANYFVWRQRDAVRNSILMVGQHHFSHTELHGKSTDEVQELLFTQRGVNWGKLPGHCKRGRLTVYSADEGWVTFAAPTFKAEAGSYLAHLIPPLPRLDD